MKIEFVELNRDNWENCANLTDKEDNYIYPNLYSIAEAQFYEKAISRAIFSNEEMVGYSLFGEDENDSEVWAIDRFMIAKAFRRNGYGAEAIIAIVEEGRSRGFKRFITSTAEKNEAMQSLLTKLGFKTNLEKRDNEIVYFIEE
jgi:diamine N-acetyltransferase